jgi:uncharacterized lipoprotein YmbA
MRNVNLLGLVCLPAALVSLTGCAGKIRYPSYYVLNLPAPVPQGTQPKPLLGSVAVREFRAPAFLRAGPIMYRQSTGHLDFYDYHRWAVDPRSAVTNAVVQNMQTGGAFQAVHLFDGREASDYLITGTLDHLEEVDQGHDVFVESTCVGATDAFEDGRRAVEGSILGNHKAEDPRRSGYRSRNVPSGGRRC